MPARERVAVGAKPPSVRVEVVQVGEHGAYNQALTLPPNATVADAVAASRFCDPPAAVGVHGEVASMDQTLRDGDRIDLLRPLLVDPMEGRRLRAFDQRK